MTRPIGMALIALLALGCSAAGQSPAMNMGGVAEAAPSTGGETAASTATATPDPAPPAAETAGEAAAQPARNGEGTSPPGGALAAVVVQRGGGGDGQPERLARGERRPAPLLIYTADLQMMVDGEEIPATIDRIIEQAVALGGYLASRDDRSVQVRVPSEHFREGLSAFEQLGDVHSRRVRAQDVTEEYHDLDVRLQNLRATRSRLEAFLDRATSIEEVLRVHAELERVAREIDAAEGRLRFLRARVAFSLVSVTLEPTPVIVVEAEPEPTEPAAPPPPPPARRPDLPVSWLDQMGFERLIDFSEED